MRSSKQIVYKGDGGYAARAALGQLMFYRHFLYSTPIRPKLIALFNEEVGSACVSALEEFGIGSVWKDGPLWRGSALAVAAVIAQRASRGKSDGEDCDHREEASRFNEGGKTFATTNFVTYFKV